MLSPTAANRSDQTTNWRDGTRRSRPLPVLRLDKGQFWVGTDRNRAEDLRCLQEFRHRRSSAWTTTCRRFTYCTIEDLGRWICCRDEAAPAKLSSPHELTWPAIIGLLCSMRMEMEKEHEQGPKNNLLRWCICICNHQLQSNFTNITQLLGLGTLWHFHSHSQHHNSWWA
jgi:hypothetical protein